MPYVGGRRRSVGLSSRVTDPVLFHFTDGKAAGVYDYGLIIFFSVIVVVTVRLMFELKMVTLLATFFMAISLILWWISWCVVVHGSSGCGAVRCVAPHRAGGFVWCPCSAFTQ